MITTTNKYIEQLTVNFYEVDSGWLFFKLTVGQQIFDGRFSEVFDPLLDFKHWLEAISIGVQQTSFQYDSEGNYIKFDFEQFSWDRCELTISEPYEDGEVFIKSTIDRKQIVKAFYLGLLTFAASDKFKSDEWEVEYLKERLCKILGRDEATLIEELKELDRKELGLLLFNSDPSYTVSFPTAKDKSEEMKLFIETDVQNKELPEEHLMEIKPIEWNIPDDYDFWTSDRKREFVIECINETTQGYRGTKIDDFRSSIIEKYLENE